MPDNDDYIEFGESGLVPLKDGWYLNRGTGEKISPDGQVFSEDGTLIFDPAELDDIPAFFSEDEYDLYDDEPE